MSAARELFEGETHSHSSKPKPGLAGTSGQPARRRRYESRFLSFEFHVKGCAQQCAPVVKMLLRSLLTLGDKGRNTERHLLHGGVPVAGWNSHGVLAGGDNVAANIVGSAGNARSRRGCSSGFETVRG